MPFYGFLQEICFSNVGPVYLWGLVRLNNLKAPFTRYNVVSNPLYNPFDNRLNEQWLFEFNTVVKPV